MLAVIYVIWMANRKLAKIEKCMLLMFFIQI